MNKQSAPEERLSAPSSVNLDISLAEFSADGVKDFYWPYNRTEMVPVRDSLLRTLIPFLQRKDLVDHETALAVQLLFKWLASEIIRLFEATVVHRRFAQKGISLEVPRRFQVLFALVENRRPPCVLFHKLASGPARGVLLPGLAKRLIRESQWNGWSARTLRHFDAKRDTVTVEPTGLTIEHARATGVFLRYGHLREWFPPMDPGRLTRSAALSAESDTVNGVVASLRQAFADGGKDASELIVNYIKDWLIQGRYFVNFHLSCLNENREKLPARLWTGSVGATVWVRMLAYAVRRHGGYVTAHDHGYGNSHHEQLGHHFTSFEGSDEFFTYNRTSAEIKKRELQAGLILSGPPSAITCPETYSEKASVTIPVPRDMVVESAIRKIMYVATAFHGDRARFRPIFSDLVALDWQARLFGFLKSLGVEVLHKPHPEGASQPPAGFAESFGFHTIHGRFEQIRESVDAYIIDFNSSSTTMSILKSSLPVIFIDMGYPELFPEAKTLLDRRCYTIPAWTDRDNRVQIDWDQLRVAITAPRHRFDTAFTDVYYANI